MRELIGLVFFMAFAPATAHAMDHCFQPEVHAAAQRVKEAQTKLLAFKVNGVTGDMDEGVPTDLQAEIRAMKDALTAGADEVMQCAAPDVPKSSFENSLTNFLIAAKPSRRPAVSSAKDFVYGKELGTKVSMSEQIRRIVLVEFHFDIACGSDSMLLGYEQREGRWQRVIRWQSGDYDSISGAFGDFFKYAVIPQPAPRGWILVVAHGTPWCTSNMSGFTVDLIEPAQGQSPQRAFGHLEHEYRRDYDTELKATADGFQMRVHADTLDGDILFRPAVFRYRIDGDKLERVQPIANNGRDFVDEWLQVPWSDAQRWSAPDGLSPLEEVHRRVQTERSGNGEDWPLITYGAVRGCSDSPMHFQVEMTEDRSMNKPTRPNTSIYFQIEVGKNSATMLSAFAALDPRCTGKDIMPKR